MFTLTNPYQQSSELVEISQRDWKKGIQAPFSQKTFINHKKNLKGQVKTIILPFLFHCVVQMEKNNELH